MKDETRLLYLAIIALLVITTFLLIPIDGKRIEKAYKHGIEKGKLIKMEQQYPYFPPATPNYEHLNLKQEEE